MLFNATELFKPASQTSKNFPHDCARFKTPDNDQTDMKLRCNVVIALVTEEVQSLVKIRKTKVELVASL